MKLCVLRGEKKKLKKPVKAVNFVFRRGAPHPRVGAFPLLVKFVAETMAFFDILIHTGEKTIYFFFYVSLYDSENKCVSSLRYE